MRENTAHHDAHRPVLEALEARVLLDGGTVVPELGAPLTAEGSYGVAPAARSFDFAAQAVSIESTGAAATPTWAGQVSVTDLTTGQALPSSALQIEHDPTRGATRITAPGLPGGRFPYGHELQVKVPASAVTDGAEGLLDGNADGVGGDGFTWTFTAAGPGDADCNGQVGREDLQRLKAHFGQAGAGWGGGDLNYDGKVDAFDYLSLKRAYGHTYDTGGQPAVATVLPSGDRYAGGDFQCTSLAVASQAWPAPFAPAGLSGGGACASSLSGSVPYGAADAWSLDLAAGQSLCVRCQQGSSGAVALELYGPDQGMLQRVALSASAPVGMVGQAPVAVAGTYTVKLVPTSGTNVTYTLEVTLGAVPEAEACGGAGNDDPDTAQDLSMAWQPAGEGGQRTAILGRTSKLDLDQYPVTLQEGERLYVVAATRTPGSQALPKVELRTWDGIVPEEQTIPGPRLSVKDNPGGPPGSKLIVFQGFDALRIGGRVRMDVGGVDMLAWVTKQISKSCFELDRLLPTGSRTIYARLPISTTLIATGLQDAKARASEVRQFVAPAAGTYYVCVSTDSTAEIDYDLAILRGVALAARPGDSFDSARPLPGGDVVGRFAGPGDPGDYFSLDALPGDELAIRTETLPPLPVPGHPLDPVLELYDSSGSLVAWDDNGAGDGVNARIAYTVPQTHPPCEGAASKYVVRVLGAGGTAGEYLLHASGGTAPAVLRVIAATPRLAQSYSTVRLEFGYPVLPSSAQPGGVTVGGAATNGVTAIDSYTLAFQLTSPLTEEGVYDVSVAAGAIVDSAGRPVEAFHGQVRVDCTLPKVAGASYDFATQTVSIRITEPVVVSSWTNAFCVIYLDCRCTLDQADLAVEYDAVSRTVRITAPGLPGGMFPYGRELGVGLAASALADEAGNLLDGNGDGAGGDDFMWAFTAAGPGDADCNGRVDRNDLLRLKNHMGASPATWADGDLNYDSKVDAFDYLVLKRAYGNTYDTDGALLDAAPAGMPAGESEAVSMAPTPRGFRSRTGPAAGPMPCGAIAQNGGAAGGLALPGCTAALAVRAVPAAWRREPPRPAPVAWQPLVRQFGWGAAASRRSFGAVGLQPELADALWLPALAVRLGSLT